MKIKTLCAFLVCATFALAPALAGVVFQVETAYHSGSPSSGPQDSQMSAEGRNLKMEILPGEEGRGRGDMIFRGERREMVIVDHDDKSYYVMDEETLGQLAGQVSGAMSQMEKQMQEALKNMPEDERRKIEEMMKQRMPAQAPERPKSELRRTGETGTKSGYPCVKYEIWRGGSKLRELWVTDWGNIDGGEEMSDVWGEMARFFRELMDKLTGSMPGGGGIGGPGDDTIFEHMEQIDGFPVVSRGFDDDGSLEDESTLRSASRRTLDPADFEPPAGYKRRSMGPF